MSRTRKCKTRLSARRRELNSRHRPRPGKIANHLDRFPRGVVASGVDDRGGCEIAVRLQRHDREKRLRAAGVHARARTLPLLNTPAEGEILVDRRMQPTKGVEADEPRHASKP